MAVLWDGATGNSQARTTDISEGGCFIDTMGQVAVGEMLHLKFMPPDGEYIAVEGAVVYELTPSGFAVRFTKISDSDRKRLEALIKAAD